MTSALIGNTGFVGSNLALRHRFDHVYNSKNIGEIVGREYDLVVSAGTRADSFRINNNPEQDLREVDGLIDLVSQASIDRLVVISTVCVYPGGTSPDEAAPLNDDGLTPYGRNRLHQEQRFGSLFDTTIVRLPQLYGDNLKKGIIYDLINDYRVEFIDPDGSFQYYDVRTLWDHIQVLLANNVESFNAASPAISHRRVASEVFGVDISGNPSAEGNTFSEMYTRDMQTRHAGLFGGRDGYICDVGSELADIKRFVADHSTNQGRG